MSILEVVNLLSIGLASYNFKLHVASDIPTNGLFIDPRNMLTQEYLDKITDWTKANKMMLNKEKSKTMVFNFTRDFQFATRVSMENSLTILYLECIFQISEKYIESPIA